MAEMNRDELLHRYRRRLQKLKEQEAAFGLYTPPYILTEIEDLEMQIREIGGQGSSTPSDAQADSPRQIGILFLAANPSGTERLRLDHEVRAIDQVLQMAEFRDRFVIWQHWAVRIGDLPELLMRHKPAVVHFSGHGSDAGEIILENSEGQSFVVPARALTGLFGILRDNIRCVVLNACYSHPQAEAIAEVVDCVVGMPGVIGDQAAIRFSGSFYQALGYGKDVKAAFDLASVQLALEGLASEGMPSLLATRVDPGNVVLC